MKFEDLKRKLNSIPNFYSTPYPKLVLIQLPDNEPPVSFVVEDFGDTVILFPTPHDPTHSWDHDTNIIRSSPL